MDANMVTDAAVRDVIAATADDAIRVTRADLADTGRAAGVRAIAATGAKN